MGLKDVRRGANLNNSDHRPPANKIRPVPVYASEQSLPEKVSQALKGLAIRPVSLRHNGAVTADDVVYYSSGSNNSSYDGGNGRKSSNNGLAYQNGVDPKQSGQLLKRTLSKSTEKLNLNNIAASGGQLRVLSSNHQRLQENGGAASDQSGAAHYSKVKQYSYGVNLEDLRKMYKSMPNCSADDEYDEAANSTVQTSASAIR